MTEDTETPVVVNDSPLPAMIRSFIRTVVIILSLFAPDILAKHSAQLDFLQSEQFRILITTLTAAVMALWSQIEAILHKQELKAAANAAPNSQFVVKSVPLWQTLYQAFGLMKPTL